MVDAGLGYASRFQLPLDFDICEATYRASQVYLVCEGCSFATALFNVEHEKDVIGCCRHLVRETIRTVYVLNGLLPGVYAPHSAGKSLKINGR